MGWGSEVHESEKVEQPLVEECKLGLDDYEQLEHKLELEQLELEHKLELEQLELEPLEQEQPLEQGQSVG